MAVLTMSNEHLDELELAYQRALAAVEAIESTLPDEVATGAEWTSEAVPDQTFGAAGPEAVAPIRLHVPGEPPSRQSEVHTRLSPRQVIEAALFVGGEPLTARKLCSLLAGDSDHEFVDRTIEALNGQYAAQGRPLVIRLVEGGYRLELRSEFESVRNRVFGYGPRDVRLSQEALEILALVAYRQPVTRPQIEQLLGRPAAGTLSQLLRRELIALQRGEETGSEVTYHTTARFLELFGLGSVQELPQPDDLSFK